MNTQKTKLTSLILALAQEHPEGLSHRELVTLVLQTGFRYSGTMDFSTYLRQIVRSLVASGCVYEPGGGGVVNGATLAQSDR